MLSKIFRLPSKEISEVLRSGKRQSYKFFNTSFLPSANPLFCVIVPNKIDKRATVRNKIKRRIKEAIQKNLSKFNNKKTIFFAKKEILSAPYSEILEEINNIVI